MTERNQDFLRQFEDPANVQALVNLPQRILAGIPKTGKPTRRHALDVQVAVAIEILLMLPLMVRRTLIEERMLASALPGYTEYTRQVRFRIIPGVW